MSVQKPHTPEIESSRVRDLQLVVELGYPDGCPLSTVDERVCDLVVRRQDGCCHADFLVEADDSKKEREIRHQTGSEAAGTSSKRDCICKILGQYDCLPHFTDMREDSVIVTTYPPNRETATEVLTDLKDRCRRVRLVRLRESTGEIGGDCRAVDLSNLTPKQREAMRQAYEAEFFERGSETTLEELATEQGISAAAFSQRLTRAKSELFGQIFGT